MSKNKDFDVEISYESISKKFKEEAEHLHDEAANLFQRKITPRISGSKLQELAYLYKGRTKTVEGLINKVHRKRIDKESPRETYGLADITDVIGIRFVTLYKHEIKELLEFLLFDLTGRNDLTDKYVDKDREDTFMEGKITEVKVYAGYKGEAATEVRNWLQLIRNYHKEIKCEKPSQNSDSDYSSIHIVIVTKELPIEIQIRSVFDDAWAELNHKFKYRKDSGKSTKVGVNNEKLVNLMLSNLKGFTDNCSEFADLIHKEATMNENPESIPKPIVHSHVDGHEVIKALSSISVERTWLEKLKNVFDKKDAAIKDQADDEQLREISSDFKELCMQYDNNGGKNMAFHFYCMMNSSLCLLSASSKKLHNEAALGYQKVLELEGFSEHPMANYRYGQALEQIDRSDEGLEYIYKSHELAIKENGKNFSESHFLRKDYLHIAAWAPLKIGFNEWVIADTKFKDSKISKGEFLDACKLAYKRVVDTLEILEKQDFSSVDNERLKRVSHNNGLYYATEIFTYLESDEEKKEWSKKVSAHLEYCEDYVELREFDLNKRDSRGRGYFVLGQYEKASEFFTYILSFVSRCREGSLKDNYTSDELLNLFSDATSKLEEIERLKKLSL